MGSFLRDTGALAVVLTEDNQCTTFDAGGGERVLPIGCGLLQDVFARGLRFGLHERRHAIQHEVARVFLLAMW